MTAFTVSAVAERRSSCVSTGSAHQPNAGPAAVTKSAATGVPAARSTARALDDTAADEKATTGVEPAMDAPSPDIAPGFEPQNSTSTSSFQTVHGLAGSLSPDSVATHISPSASQASASATASSWPFAQPFAVATRAMVAPAAAASRAMPNPAGPNPSIAMCLPSRPPSRPAAAAAAPTPMSSWLNEMPSRSSLPMRLRWSWASTGASRSALSRRPGLVDRRPLEKSSANSSASASTAPVASVGSDFRPMLAPLRCCSSVAKT